MDTERLGRLFDLSGRTAIITGGTRGIGFSLARGHLAAGANVVLTGRSPERCAEVERGVDCGVHVRAIRVHLCGGQVGSDVVDPVDTDMVRKNTPEFIEGMAHSTLLG